MVDLYSYQNLILFLARVVLGVTFIKHGWPKIKKPFGLKGMLAGLKFPIPAFLSVAVAIIEFVGGMLLLVGYNTQLASLLISADMAVAASVKKFHSRKRWMDPVRGLARAKGASLNDLGEATSNGVDGYELELALMCLALLLAMFGGGDWALQP